jgi:hypothetical protein
MDMGLVSDHIKGVLALDPDAFRSIVSMSDQRSGVWWVVLAAGLSQGIGRGIILFVNRVKPVRFVLSLVLGAILFAVGYSVWVGCTWAIARWIYDLDVSLILVARVLAFSFAPFLLAFLTALPYLGVPWAVILWIWSLLAVVTGMVAVTGLSRWDAFWCVVLGAILQDVIERTVGQPVTLTGQRLSNAIAGVELNTNLRNLERRRS